MMSEREMFISEEEMLCYEEAFEVMCRRYPVVVICKYDVRQCDGVALLRALKAHPDLSAVWGRSSSSPTSPAREQGRKRAS